MSEIICKECGHPITEHVLGGCLHESDGQRAKDGFSFCECTVSNETLLENLKQVEANYDALQSPMPCGHLARYAVNGEDGTQYCCMCVLEADKQTIANLVMVDVEEPENEKCPFCQTRAILTRVGELLDLTPEIGSPHYDDVIADLINDTSSANSTFQCYCEETNHE